MDVIIREELLARYKLLLTNVEIRIIKKLERCPYKWKMIRLDLIGYTMLDFVKHFLNYEVKHTSDGKKWVIFEKRGFEYIMVRKKSTKLERDIERDEHMKRFITSKHILGQLNEKDWRVINEVENNFIKVGNAWNKINLKRVSLQLLMAVMFYFNYEIKRNKEGMEISTKGEIKLRKK